MYKVNDRVVQSKPQEVYAGHYIMNIAQSLLKFINNDITETEVKDFLKQNEILTFGCPKMIKYSELSNEDLVTHFENLVK